VKPDKRFLQRSSLLGVQLLRAKSQISNPESQIPTDFGTADGADLRRCPEKRGKLIHTNFR
jgi:hypothetical protein